MRGIPWLFAVATAVVFVAARRDAWAGKLTALVPMRDDVKLATDVYLPDGGNGPWPVLLFRTPYDKSTDTGGLLSYVPLGVAAVVQDMRGRFASEGVDLVFTSDGDGALKDGYDTMEWILAQSWCDGHIGTRGGSARGIVQYMQASARPPGLKVLDAAVGTPNLYRDAMFNGGVFRHSLVTGWLQAQGSLHFLDEIAAHPYVTDPFWAPVQTEDQYQSVDVPGIHEGGWYDIFVQGTIDAFVGYQHHGGPGAKGKQKLILGPWPHALYQTTAGELVYPQSAATPPYAQAFETMFNHYLEYGAPSITDKPEDVPTVQYYVMGAVGEPGAPGNLWRTADDWPPAAAPVRMHLQADRTLAEACPATGEGATEYVFDPADPSPTICGRNLNLPAGSCDQQPLEQRTDVVLFSTPPLGEPLEITGRVRAHLFVAIDQIDADVMVRLTDVYPDGRSMLVADGARRLSAKADASGLVKLTPGEIVEAVVDLWSTSIVLAPGHRLRISITSGNYPRYAVNQHNGLDYPASIQGAGPPVTVRVHHDATHASYLEVPDPRRDPADFVDCEPEGGSGSGAGTGAGGAGGAGNGGDAAGGSAPTPAPGSASGCGCRYANGSSLHWAWLALLLAAAARRARATRRRQLPSPDPVPALRCPSRSPRIGSAWLLALAVGCASWPACDAANRSSTASTSNGPAGAPGARDRTPPVFDMNLSRLTPDDLKRGGSALGLGEPHELVVVTTESQDRRAGPGPSGWQPPLITWTLEGQANGSDHKTGLSLYTFANQAAAEVHTKALRLRGQATRIEGARVFAVSCSTATGVDCKADATLLVKLFGQ